MSTKDEHQQLATKDISVVQHRIIRLVHDQRTLTGIDCGADGIVTADALFFNSQHRGTCRILEVVGCQCDKGTIAISNLKQQTNQPGIFVAGDADGEVQFAIVAAAEGATAAVAINRELQDENRR